jgi:hypothetical protein
MRKLIAAAIAALILASVAPAQQKGSPRSFKDFIKEPAFAVKVAGGSFDFGTSLKIDGVRLREANPLFRRADGGFSPARNLLFTAGVTYLQFELYKRNRKAALVLMIAEGAIRGFAGARNLRLITSR